LPHYAFIGCSGIGQLSFQFSVFKEFVRVSVPSSLLSQPELEQQIHVRTGRRVRNLVVELESECVILRGQVTSYYVKQLAQQSVQDLMPQARLDNAIVVETR
jgi:hypothetical protein